MAVTQTIIKRTQQEAIVKVGGTGGSSTIALDDLVSHNQIVEGTDQRVDIVGATVTGLLSSAITITRNGVATLAFAGENSAIFDFEGQGFRDFTNNDKDIVVTIAGAEAHIYLTLRKVSGYTSTVETAKYGSYDDPAAVGAVTNVTGSPDYAG
jgi:hypothetical protein